MELTTKGRYAVMAMADLARAHAAQQMEVAVPLSAIAERQQISLAYLEQLFVKLRRASLVDSARGRNGGYVLSRPAELISVGEVMAAVNEDVRMTRCAGEVGVPCLAGERCLTHDLWDALGTHIEQFLSGVSIADVVEGRLQRSASARSDLAVVRAGGMIP